MIGHLYVLSGFIVPAANAHARIFLLLLLSIMQDHIYDYFQTFKITTSIGSIIQDCYHDNFRLFETIITIISYYSVSISIQFMLLYLYFIFYFYSRLSYIRANNDVTCLGVWAVFRKD